MKLRFYTDTHSRNVYVYSDNPIYKGLFVTKGYIEPAIPTEDDVLAYEFYTKILPIHARRLVGNIRFEELMEKINAYDI